MYVDITLDKPRRLRFDMTAYRALEEAMGGQPIGAIIPQLKQLGVTATGLALWAALRHDDRKLTRSDVDRLLDQSIETHGSILPVTTALIEAIDESALFRGMAVSAEGNGQPEPTAPE